MRSSLKPRALECIEHYHKQAEIIEEPEFEKDDNVESSEVRQPSTSILLACLLGVWRITTTCGIFATAQSGEGQSRSLEQPISRHVNVAWIVQAIAIKQRESERPRLHNVLKHFWPRVEKRPASSSCASLRVASSLVLVIYPRLD